MGEKASPAFAMKGFAGRLVRGPCATAGRRSSESDAVESLGCRQVGDLDAADAVTPYIAGEVHEGRDASFRQMAVPLGRHGGRVVGEVESVHDAAALPAVVARGLRTVARVGVVGDVSEPVADGVDGVDVERQEPVLQAAPGDSSSETTRATRRAWPRAISSSGLWSSSEATGFDSQTGM